MPTCPTWHARRVAIYQVEAERGGHMVANLRMNCWLLECSLIWMLLLKELLEFLLPAVSDKQ